MEVGIEGQMKRSIMGLGADVSSALCMWLLCNYCRFSVSTVLLHYMKDSYLLCQKEHLYPSLILFQVLKNLKAFQPSY